MTGGGRIVIWSSARTARSCTTACDVLELGAFDSAILQRVLEELDTAPDTLLPDLIMQLQIIAFHTWKAGRTGLSLRIIMTSLAWYLRNPVDAEMVDVLTKVVRTIGETDETELPAETIHAAALAGLATGDESWRLDADAFGSAVPVIDIGDTQNQRQRYQRGFTPLIRSRLPFTRFTAG